MNKRMVLLVVVYIFVSVGLCACSNESDAQMSKNEKLEKEIENIPDISRVRAICELATLECYYHNVAKTTKEKGVGFTHIGEKDRKLWIEYDGVVRLGIDASKVTMTHDGNKIVITIPRAKLLDMPDYSFMEDNYILSEDGFNKNKITPEVQTEALADANEQIKQRFSNDATMLARAQNRAKELIENYINHLNEASGVAYQIEWVYEENIPQENGEEITE